jgi:hypothetical protein
MGTIDLSLGHVDIMHEGNIGVLIQPLGLIVTGVTPVLGRVAFTQDDVPVAFFAGNMAGSGKIQMIEGETLEQKVLLGKLVTGRAISQG